MTISFEAKKLRASDLKLSQKGSHFIPQNDGDRLRITSGKDRIIIAETLASPLFITSFVSTKTSLIIEKDVEALVIFKGDSLHLNIEVKNGARANFYYVPDEKEVDLFSNQSFFITIGQNASVRIFEMGFFAEKIVRVTDVLLLGKASTISYYAVDQLSSDADKKSNLNIVHRGEQSCSEQHVRGVYGGSAKGHFLGKVIVEKSAPHCKAYQLYKAILVDERAKATILPELEINNNDVSASHGATIGQLDADSLFYLCSRGIEINESKALILDGFLKDIVQEISNDLIKNALNFLIKTSINQAVAAKL